MIPLSQGSSTRFALAAALVGLLVAACGSAAAPTGVPVELEPTVMPDDPTIMAERDPRNSRLLKVMEELPLSFKEEGLWFADFGRARELAGVPQPGNLAGFLALSEDEREAYQAATQGLVQGPGLFSSIQDIREWEQSLGFTQFNVVVAVSTGEINPEAPPREAAYLMGEFDQARLRQGLLDMGYIEGSVKGVTYYDAPRSTLESTRSNPLSFIAYNSMKRVVLGEGTLAISGVQSIDLLPSFPGVALGEVPSLDDDVAFSELAALLWNPLSAVLLTRSMVLEPAAARPPRYEKPEDWGDLHQWEALGIGYGISLGVPRLTLALFYPDRDAAEADWEELTLRMSGYDSAIPLMYPEMPAEQLALMPMQPVDAICEALNAGTRSGGFGSILTMRCDIKDQAIANIWWSQLLNMRDLGFLLP